MAAGKEAVDVHAGKASAEVWNGPRVAGRERAFWRASSPRRCADRAAEASSHEAARGRSGLCRRGAGCTVPPPSRRRSEGAEGCTSMHTGVEMAPRHALAHCGVCARVSAPCHALTARAALALDMVIGRSADAIDGAERPESRTEVGDAAPLRQSPSDEEADDETGGGGERGRA